MGLKNNLFVPKYRGISKSTPEPIQTKIKNLFRMLEFKRNAHFKEKKFSSFPGLEPESPGVRLSTLPTEIPRRITQNRH